jgi:FkbM family methyltransferase
VKDTKDISKRYMKESYAQLGEDLILQRIFIKLLFYPKGYIGTYFDVGAYHPFNDSNTYFLYKQKWKGFVFDVSEVSCEQLRMHRERDSVFNVAVGRENLESCTIYMKNDSDSDQSKVNTLYPSQKHISTYSAKELVQRNIDYFVEKYAVNKIDFLNIDVEGAELDILHGIDWERTRPVVIAIEIHSKDKDILNGLASQEAKFLFSNNYRCVAISAITYFFVDKEEHRRAALSKRLVV